MPLTEKTTSDVIRGLPMDALFQTMLLNDGKLMPIYKATRARLSRFSGEDSHRVSIRGCQLVGSVGAEQFRAAISERLEQICKAANLPKGTFNIVARQELAGEKAFDSLNSESMFGALKILDRFILDVEWAPGLDMVSVVERTMGAPGIKKLDTLYKLYISKGMGSDMAKEYLGITFSNRLLDLPELSRRSLKDLNARVGKSGLKNNRLFKGIIADLDAGRIELVGLHRIHQHDLSESAMLEVLKSNRLLSQKSRLLSQKSGASGSAEATLTTDVDVVKFHNNGFVFLYPRVVVTGQELSAESRMLSGAVIQVSLSKDDSRAAWVSRDWLGAKSECPLVTGLTREGCIQEYLVFDALEQIQGYLKKPEKIDADYGFDVVRKEEWKKIVSDINRRGACTVDEINRVVSNQYELKIPIELTLSGASGLILGDDGSVVKMVKVPNMPVNRLLSRLSASSEEVYFSVGSGSSDGTGGSEGARVLRRISRYISKQISALPSIDSENSEIEFFDMDFEEALVEGVENTGGDTGTEQELTAHGCSSSSRKKRSAGGNVCLLDSVQEEENTLDYESYTEKLEEANEKLKIIGELGALESTAQEMSEELKPTGAGHTVGKVINRANQAYAAFNLCRDAATGNMQGVVTNLAMLSLPKIVDEAGESLVASARLANKFLGESAAVFKTAAVRGTGSAFIAADLYRWVQALGKDDGGSAALNVLNDSIMLTIDAAELGAEIIGVELGPVGAVITFALLVSAAAGEGGKRVVQITQDMPLSLQEKIKEGLRGALGLEMSEDVALDMDRLHANQNRRDMYFAIIEDPQSRRPTGIGMAVFSLGALKKVNSEVYTGDGQASWLGFLTCGTRKVTSDVVIEVDTDDFIHLGSKDARPDVGHASEYPTIPNNSGSKQLVTNARNDLKVVPESEKRLETKKSYEPKVRSSSDTCIPYTDQIKGIETEIMSPPALQKTLMESLARTRPQESCAHNVMVISNPNADPTSSILVDLLSGDDHYSTSLNRPHLFLVEGSGEKNMTGSTSANDVAVLSGSVSGVINLQHGRNTLVIKDYQPGVSKLKIDLNTGVISNPDNQVELIRILGTVSSFVGRSGHEDLILTSPVTESVISGDTRGSTGGNKIVVDHAATSAAYTLKHGDTAEFGPQSKGNVKLERSDREGKIRIRIKGRHNGSIGQINLDAQLSLLQSFRYVKKHKKLIVRVGNTKVEIFKYNPKLSSFEFVLNSGNDLIVVRPIVSSRMTVNSVVADSLMVYVVPRDNESKDSLRNRMERIDHANFTLTKYGVLDNEVIYVGDRHTELFYLPDTKRMPSREEAIGGQSANIPSSEALPKGVEVHGQGGGDTYLVGGGNYKIDYTSGDVIDASRVFKHAAKQGYSRGELFFHGSKKGEDTIVSVCAKFEYLQDNIVRTLSSVNIGRNAGVVHVRFDIDGQTYRMRRVPGRSARNHSIDGVTGMFDCKLGADRETYHCTSREEQAVTNPCLKRNTHRLSFAYRVNMLELKNTDETTALHASSLSHYHSLSFQNALNMAFYKADSSLVLGVNMGNGSYANLVIIDAYPRLLTNIYNGMKFAIFAGDHKCDEDCIARRMRNPRSYDELVMAQGQQIERHVIEPSHISERQPIIIGHLYKKIGIVDISKIMTPYTEITSAVDGNDLVLSISLAQQQHHMVPRAAPYSVEYRRRQELLRRPQVIRILKHEDGRFMLYMQNNQSIGLFGFYNTTMLDNDMESAVQKALQSPRRSARSAARLVEKGHDEYGYIEEDASGEKEDVYDNMSSRNADSNSGAIPYLTNAATKPGSGIIHNLLAGIHQIPAWLLGLGSRPQQDIKSILRNSPSIAEDQAPAQPAIPPKHTTELSFVNAQTQYMRDVATSTLLINSPLNIIKHNDGSVHAMRITTKDNAYVLSSSNIVDNEPVVRLYTDAQELTRDLHAKGVELARIVFASAAVANTNIVATPKGVTVDMADLRPCEYPSLNKNGEASEAAAERLLNQLQDTWVFNSRDAKPCMSWHEVACGSPDDNTSRCFAPSKYEGPIKQFMQQAIHDFRQSEFLSHFLSLDGVVLKANRALDMVIPSVTSTAQTNVTACLVADIAVTSTRLMVGEERIGAKTVDRLGKWSVYMINALAYGNAISIASHVLSAAVEVGAAKGYIADTKTTRLIQTMCRVMPAVEAVLTNMFMLPVIVASGYTAEAASSLYYRVRDGMSGVIEGVMEDAVCGLLHSELECGSDSGVESDADEYFDAESDLPSSEFCVGDVVSGSVVGMVR